MGEQRPPLAERMRPVTFDEFVGQEHLAAEGKLLRTLVTRGALPSLILWGPPGCGKTTLARLIAGASDAEFVQLSAVTAGIVVLRKIVAEARERAEASKKQTLLFVDEIHRWNKAQQDALLPHVEQGTIALIGATTENPSFEIIAPLLSRCRVFVLSPLPVTELGALLDRALIDPRGLQHLHVQIDPDAREAMVQYAFGDARVALNALEVAAQATTHITTATVKEVFQRANLLYDKGGEEHFNVISAFIKSIRGSNPDAALYWCARMLEAGEDPMFIARRMVVLASEDIGNADFRAQLIATSAMQAVHLVGMPEARIILAQAVTYLATAKKSNASYVGIEKALADVREHGALPIPLHLRNAPTKFMKDLGYGKEYIYTHDDPDSEQQFLPDALKGRKYYESGFPPTRE